MSGRCTEHHVIIKAHSSQLLNLYWFTVIKQPPSMLRM